MSLAPPWLPMHTAPRSRDISIDLVLCHRPSGLIYRAPDCHWTNYEWCWADKSGASVCGKTFADWRNHGGDLCFDPSCADEMSTVALGWMYPPNLPTAEA